MKKKIIILLLVLQALSVTNSFSSDPKKIELEIGYNSLKGSMMENPYYHVLYNNGYPVNFFEGVNINLSRSTNWKDVSVLIGGIILYNEYSDYNSPKITDYTLRGGGIYTGIQFSPTILNLSGQSGDNKIGLKTQLAIGYFSFGENLVLSDRDTGGIPLYTINEKNNCSGLGSIIEFGPKLNLNRFSFSFSGKSLITGGTKLVVTTVGIAGTIGVKF